MAHDHYEALARTTLLLNNELFSAEADERKLADALLETTVRLVAEPGAVSCRAGQTAVVTAFSLVARLGIGIELDMPNVPLLDPVAPLRGDRLVDALLELGADLVPGALVRARPGDVDETFVFGAQQGHATAVHVGVSDFACELARGDEPRACSGELPYGGFAAGASVAPIALEAAMERLERAAGRPARRPRPSPGPPVSIDLLSVFPGLSNPLTLDFGNLDVVSGGAITHAFLFCLLRLPGASAHARIIEEQLAELTNVNRYKLLRASDAGRIKVEQLEAVAAHGVEITGVRALFTKATRENLLPFADHVLVGVDDVEARWWVQEEDPLWVAVGATGNHLAQLTTHSPDSACAACIHSTPLPEQIIPTISFVSLWAGLMQACALVSGVAGGANFVVYPFALGGPTSIGQFDVLPSQNCPIGCSASSRIRTS
jgi:molybdopterin/thiamine biosynthesis adenylyltransferase